MLSIEPAVTSKKKHAQSFSPLFLANGLIESGSPSLSSVEPIDRADGDRRILEFCW
jgi:hypothetical protein